MKKAFIIFIIQIISFFLVSAQNIDSLINRLAKAQGEQRLELLLDITWEYRNINPEKAIEFCEQAKKLADSLKNYEALAKANSFMGVLYRNLGYYGVAFSYYKHGMEIAKKYNVISQLGYSYNNIGNIYLYQNEPELAIKFLRQADSLAHIYNNYDLQAYAVQNIARAFLLLNEIDSAIKYLKLTVKIRKEHKIYSKLPVTYKYLADSYKAKGDYKRAIEYYHLTESSIDFSTDLDLYADYLVSMSDLYLKLNKLDTALFYASKGLEIAEQVHILYRKFLAFKILAKIFQKKQDYYNAYKALDSAMTVYQHLYTDEVVKSIKSIQFTEQALKQEAEIAKLKYELDIKKLQDKRKQLIIIILIGFILFVLTVFRMYVRKEKQLNHYLEELNKRNKIIEDKNRELSQQSDELITINNQLTLRDREVRESLRYAKRILNAILTSDILMDNCGLIEECFIINKPLEELGGDFYYFNKFKNFTALVVADSTGHGVPGAMLSIISISILKDILFNIDNPDAGQVLEEFRIQIRSVLRQNEQQSDILHDSVDMALALLFPEKGILNFAGARRPLLIYTNKGEFIEIKGTKDTAGFSIKRLSFQSKTFTLSQVKRLYLFTDGITDMLINKHWERLGTIRWKKLLSDIQIYAMSGQKEIIEDTIFEWKQKGKQVDDILIVGVELKDN